jgi:predicted methyltransferase
MGHTVFAQGPFQGLLEEFITIGRERPGSISEYDQGAILPENTISRALYMYQRGDLDRQKLFFLGDDDLTSVACALTKLPAQITVLEIDRRLNDFLRQTAVTHGFANFTVLDYDARDPIPQELQGQFDVFFTDPVETLQGITLFLSRCTSALKGEGSAGYFGFTRIECPLKKWQAVESRLLEMNFAITDVIRNYHEYYLEPLGIAERGYRISTNAPIDVGTPDVNFFRSNLVRIELVGPPKPTIQEPVTWGRDLYYDEEMWVTLPDELL